MAWKKLFPREGKIQRSKHRNGNELKIIYIFRKVPPFVNA